MQQYVNVFKVTRLVSADLRAPEIYPGLGPLKEVTAVTMPKTSINKDHGVVARKCNVWLTGKVLSVEAIPISPGMQLLPNNKLRLGIFATDSGHHS